MLLADSQPLNTLFPSSVAQRTLLPFLFKVTFSEHSLTAPNETRLPHIDNTGFLHSVTILFLMFRKVFVHFLSLPLESKSRCLRS